MNILMFGWEFPPLFSGGLGVACYGLVKGLASLGNEVTFVVPYEVPGQPFVKLVSTNLDPDKVAKYQVNVSLNPYGSYAYQKEGTPSLAKLPISDQLAFYTQMSEAIAKKEHFDVIHGHDWMTFPAAIRAKAVSGKPMVLHVHSTEFDRTADHPNQFIYDIEREGLSQADKVIAVSNYTKQRIVEHYGVDAGKIDVIYNGIEVGSEPNYREKSGKIVTFIGRLTIQKGADHFLHAAKKVLEMDPEVTFIIAGKGDMEHRLIDMACQMGISKNVLFAGWVDEEKRNRLFEMSSVYVMPSLSEPFGIAALEAISGGVPVIVSKNSGVSEVVANCFKVDFWDVDEMANEILSLLHFKGSLGMEMAQQSFQELSRLSWENAARSLEGCYRRLISV
jgi:glycosyltransferase involved in cell wall biosynthesis